MVTNRKGVAIGSVSYQMYETSDGLYFPALGIDRKVHLLIDEVEIGSEHSFISPSYDIETEWVKFEDDVSSNPVSYSIRVNRSFYLYKSAATVPGDVYVAQVVIPAESEITIISGSPTLKSMVIGRLTSPPEFVAITPILV